MLRLSDALDPRFALLGLAFLTGCGEAGQEAVQSPRPAASPASIKTSADSDDVAITEADVKRPTSFTDAVSRVGGYRDTIRDEIAAGRPTKAHRALDELDIVLNWLPSIARDNGVPKDRWEEVNTTAQEIRELFNKVHSNIDDKKDPDYGSVSKDIDEAVGRLGVIKAAPSSKA